MEARAGALPAAQNAVEVRDIVVRYDRVLALDGVSLTVARGTALGIVGPNGSGKSTLLKTVAGLIRPDAGSVRVFGDDPQRLPPGSVGYVPQIEDVDFTFPVNVRDVVAMGRYPRLRPFAGFSAADRTAIDDAIAARSTSRRSRTVTSPNFRAASSSGCSSRAPSRKNRSSCCWTSRRPASMPLPRKRCCTSCATSSTAGCR
jgi:ABC-type branched-subunit amino acid transport system ATPase component